MIRYNPDESIEAPVIGVPTVTVPTLPFINVAGKTDRAYIIEITDEPNLLWEDDGNMLWENRYHILLEQQTVRIWQRARK